MSAKDSTPAQQLSDVFVVPARPGRLMSLAEIDRPRNEVDIVLDDMFGEVDSEGPGPTDALLIGGGACAAAAALIAGWPAAVLGAGLASIGIGSILPIRSTIRRGKKLAQGRKVRKLIGDGQLLDASVVPTRQLASKHNAVIDAVDPDTALGVRVRSIAHGLVEEVASLLEGHPPASAGQERYVAERVAALDELDRALQAAPVDGADHDAAVDARLAVESHADRSALTEAAELTQDLSGDQ